MIAYDEINGVPDSTNFSSLRCAKKSLAKSTYTFLFALIPFIQIYQVPGLDFGFGTLFLGISLPYALIYSRLFSKHTLQMCWPLYVFMAYVFFRSNSNWENAFLMLVATIHICAGANGSLDRDLLKKVIVKFSVIACLGIIVQSSFHYLLGINVSFVAESLCLPSYMGINTASVITGIFRPSSFFFEPAAFAQYVTVGLAFVLYVDDRKHINGWLALLLSVGIILTTSSWGVLLTCVLWLYYAIRRAWRGHSTFFFKFIFIVVVSIIVFVLLMQMSFFSNPIMRLISNVNGYNAITGRSVYNEIYLNSMQGNQVIWGVGYMDIEVYLTGYVKFLYMYGYFGVVLYLFSILYCFIKTKGYWRVIVLMYMVLFFGANVVTFIIIAFFLSLCYSGADSVRVRKGV